MPKVIDLPTATMMDDNDYLIMEESSGGTKKITKANVEAVTSSTISVASGFTAAENAVYKAGRVVQMIYWVSGTLSSGWTVVGTLPAGYRPIKTSDYLLLDNGSAPAADVKIMAGGDIQIYKLSTSSNTFRLTATFISAN